MPELKAGSVKAESPGAPSHKGETTMHNRITDAEIHYLFGKASRADAESIFAALVSVEDLFAKGTRKSEIVQQLNALLAKPLHKTVENFIRRLLQVDAQNAVHAVSVAINYAFTATHQYYTAIFHQKQKARIKATQEVKP
jgi:hypothetical protein